MRILGIESSCDDTSVALLDCSEQGCFVLAEKTASQVEIHRKYGGVVPEIAGRQHAENIIPVVEAVLTGQEKPEVIAVTAGPGLVTGLLVGVEAAKTLSYLWQIPIAAVNHIAGHAHSVQIKSQKAKGKNHSIEYPALALIVSGGHTELLLMRDATTFELIGKTRDDAAGEAFDKIAKLLGFEYPGGPKISQLAKDGNPNAISFPRPMLEDASLDFSFAGLKTAVLYWLEKHTPQALDTQPWSLPAGVFGTMPDGPTREDVCASVEQAIVDVLVGKTLRAAALHHPRSVLLGGGVSANKKLRETLSGALREQDPNLLFHVSPLTHAMDNGAMIAVAGYYLAQKGVFTDWRDMRVDPNWKVYEDIHLDF